MSDSNTPQSATPMCRCLRTKAMYLPEQEPDPLLVDFDPTEAHEVWCQRTLRAIGPDNRLVDTEACGPARSCFEPLG